DDALRAPRRDRAARPIAAEPGWQGNAADRHDRVAGIADRQCSGRRRLDTNAAEGEVAPERGDSRRTWRHPDGHRTSVRGGRQGDVANEGGGGGVDHLNEARTSGVGAGAVWSELESGATARA